MIRREFLIFGGAAAGLSMSTRSGSAQTWSERFRKTKPVEVVKLDLSEMTPGQHLMLKLGDGPIAVRYRTQVEIDDARATPMSKLSDKLARNANLRADAAATDENRSFGEKGQWLIYRPICTHLGIVTLPAHAPFGDEPYWIHCPSHGGRYDSAARIRGGPPDRNLPIPPVNLLGGGIVEIRSHDSFSNERVVRDRHPSEW